jgi:hypothetical protein
MPILKDNRDQMLLCLNLEWRKPYWNSVSIQGSSMKADRNNGPISPSLHYRLVLGSDSRGKGATFDHRACAFPRHGFQQSLDFKIDVWWAVIPNDQGHRIWSM